MLTRQARVVVIGGGAVGCSALYHLTTLGWTDVVLLERDELTAGSTWHAAGNCPRFSTSPTLLRLQRYSTDLYARLGPQLACELTYHRTGSIRLAATRDREDEFRHVSAQARAMGIDFELLSPAEARARHPFLETEGVRVALWDPDDGDIDPSQLTQALASAARSRGATIHRGTRVIAMRALESGGWRIETPAGSIEAEYVINAAGYRGGEVAAMIGEYLPIETLSHQYLVTEDIPALLERGTARLPLLRDPDVSYYLRQERHGLLLGPYESRPVAPWPEGPPAEFARELFADDIGRLEDYIAAACARLPILASAGIKRVVNGPIPYAPDGNPLMGPAAAGRNFFHCCAFTFGIVQAGGAGKAIAEWVVNGEPDFDMWPLDCRRYGSYADRRYTRARALETYGNEYGVGYPQEERPAGRPAYSSPLYERLRAYGAVYGARGGWERAVYYARAGDPGGPECSFRRPHWQRAVERECVAVMSGVALMDLPGFTRFEIAGLGAAEWLDHLIAGALPHPGRLCLSYACSPRGGVVMEATVLRWPDGRFWLTSAASAARHDEDWLREHQSERFGSLSIESLTARYGTLVVAGPRSRELLERVTGADLSNVTLPWLGARTVSIGGCEVIALRVGYVGELGFELHVDNPFLATVHARLLEAGADLGVGHFGLYAMESLRLEKCYRSWKADLTTEHSPLAASLHRFVQLDKSAPFIGREALRREAAAGPRQRFVPLLVETQDADAAPGCGVWRGTECVGMVTSGGFGYRLKRSIALAYLRAELAAPGTTLEVEILGERCRAAVGREPLYDPDNLRLRSG